MNYKIVSYTKDQRYLNYLQSNFEQFLAFFDFQPRAPSEKVSDNPEVQIQNLFETPRARFSLREH